MRHVCRPTGQMHEAGTPRPEAPPCPARHGRGPNSPLRTSALDQSVHTGGRGRRLLNAPAQGVSRQKLHMVRRQPLSAPALPWSPRNKLEAELKEVRWAERKSTFALETGRWASCCFNTGSHFVYSEIQLTREEVFRGRGPR